MHGRHLLLSGKDFYAMTMTVDNDRWVSLDTAARRLGLASSTVTEWCSVGLLHASQADGGTLVSRESLDRVTRQIMPLLPRLQEVAGLTEGLDSLRTALSAEISVLKDEVLSRRWLNNHLRFVSETFSLMLSVLDINGEEGADQKLVRYFLDGDDYKDIALLCGVPVTRVIADIRRFGRFPLRARSYMQLLQDNSRIAGLEERLRCAAERIAVLESACSDAGIEPPGSDVTLDVPPSEAVDSILDRPVTACGFTTRLTNVLLASHCTVVGDVLDYTYNELLNMRNMGRGCMGQLLEFCQKYRLQLKCTP